MHSQTRGKDPASRYFPIYFIDHQSWLFLEEFYTIHFDFNAIIINFKYVIGMIVALSVDMVDFGHFKLPFSFSSDVFGDLYDTSK